MASIYAELHVAGYVFRILRFTYGTTQATDARGRVSAKVRQGLLHLTADVPENDFLPDWARDPHKRLPAELVVRDDTGRAIETVHFAGAYCVGYAEAFESGDDQLGSYICHFILSDPDGWNWQLGGPTAYVNPIPLAPLPQPTPVLPPVAEALVEESVWTRLGLGLLGVLEAGASFPALLAGLLLLPQTANAPGIPQHPPLPNKDALRLAELERLHELGKLTTAQQAEYLALLAKVRGIHLDALDEQLREAHLRAIVPDYQNIELAGLRNECVGEFDGVNLKEKIFIEDKNADGLTRVNPKPGLSSQTAAEWADKHIYGKTTKRIKALKIAKYTYPQPAPDIEQIRDLRRLHFRLDADTPGLRAATENAMNRLRTENPGWDFTAQYGNQ